MEINGHKRSGYIKALFSSRQITEEGSEKHQHIAELMTLSAHAVSAIISSERSKLKIQSEMVAYLDHLEASTEEYCMRFVSRFLSLFANIDAAS